MAATINAVAEMAANAATTANKAMTTMNTAAAAICDGSGEDDGGGDCDILTHIGVHAIEG